MVLVASKDRKRFFVVPTLASLPEGDFLVNTLRLQSKAVNESALLDYEVPEKVAMLVAQAEQGAALSLKKEVEAFKARLQQRLDAAADEAAGATSLQDVLGNMGLDLSKWTGTTPESALAQDLVATLGDDSRPFQERWAAAIGRISDAGHSDAARSLDKVGQDLFHAIREAAQAVKDNPDLKGFEAGQEAGRAAREAAEDAE